MLSHGSADLILEACTDFWDGTDIYPLSGSDRSTTRLPFYPLPHLHTHAVILSGLYSLRNCFIQIYKHFFFSPQEEGSGFLPACMPVRLLFCICI